MKEADVLLSWKKSPSVDVSKQVIEITVDGNLKTFELGPEIESYQFVVSAKSSVSFNVTTFDEEGNQTASESYTFTLGDLEAPLPATSLFHEILAVRDQIVPVE